MPYKIIFDRIASEVGKISVLAIFTEKKIKRKKEKITWVEMSISNEGASEDKLAPHGEATSKEGSLRLLYVCAFSATSPNKQPVRSFHV